MNLAMTSCGRSTTLSCLVDSRIEDVDAVVLVEVFFSICITTKLHYRFIDGFTAWSIEYMAFVVVTHDTVSCWTVVAF